MRRRVLLGSLAAGVSFFAGCSSDGQSQQSSDDPAEDSTQEPTETDAEVTETDTETATATPEPGYTVEWTESMNTAGIRLALDHGVAVWSLNGFSIRTAGTGESIAELDVQPSTLTVGQDSVYGVLSIEQSLLSIDTATGNERWRYSLGDWFQRAIQGDATTVVPVGSELVVSAKTPTGEAQTAVLSRETGELQRVLVSGEERDAYYRAGVGDPENDRVALLGQRIGGIDTYDTKTGDVSWSAAAVNVDLGVGGGAVYTTAPASPLDDEPPVRAHDAATGEVLWETTNDRVRGLVGFTGESVVYTGGDETVGVDPDSGSVLWSFPLSNPREAVFAPERGIVTLVDDTGRLATLDGATGEPLFDEQFGFPSGGSQIVAGGAAGDEATLLLASYEGVHGVSY